MFFSKKKPALSLLLALSLILTGIPFPGSIDVVSATEVSEPSVGQTETPLVNITFDDLTLGAQFKGLSGTNWSGSGSEGYSQIVAKTVVDGNASATDYCMEFTPATSCEEGAKDRSWGVDIPTDVAFSIGSTVTDGTGRYAVVEMDMAIVGADTRTQGYRIFLSRHSSGGSHSISRVAMYDDSVKQYSNASTVGTMGAAATKGVFNHYKCVVDRETGKWTFLWNGELISSANGNIHGVDNTPELGRILFSLPIETADAVVDSKLYVDNIRVYATDVDSLPTPEPTAPPTPEPTPAPTESPYIVEALFDDQELGKNFTQLSGKNWSGSVGESAYAGHSKVVAKNTVFPDASATDYCVEFTPLSSKTRALNINFRLNLDSGKEITMGAAVDTGKYAVVEADLAIVGSLEKVNGYKFFLSQEFPVSEGTSSIARFGLYDTTLGRQVDSSAMNDEAGRPAATKGEFGHLKVVVDRETRYYTYFWNGELVESGVKNIHGVPNLGTLQFQILYETNDSETIDTKLYADNVYVYVTDEDFMPTPAPTATPEPTATPNPTAVPAGEYIVNEKFDDKDLGLKILELEDEKFHWAAVNTTVAQGVTVVSKADAGFDAEASDYCMEFDANVFTQTASDKSFDIILEEFYKIPIDTTATYDREVVVEMDIAVVSTDPKTNGWWLQIGGTRTGLTTYGRPIQLQIDDEKIMQHNSTGGGDTTIKESIKQNEFFTLKYVLPINGSGARWYVNDKLIAKGVDQLQSVQEIGQIRLLSKKEDAAVKAKLYMDNIKVSTQMLNDNELVNEHWDGYRSGESVEDSKAMTYYWHNDAAVAGKATFVQKNTFVPDADPTDYCVQISNDTKGGYWIILNDDKVVSYGEDASPKYVVVEADVATSGTLGAELQMQLSNTYPAYQSMERLKFNGTTMTTHGAGVETELEPNTFHSVKFVIDRTTQKYSYLVDGVVETLNRDKIHEKHDSFGNIKFNINGSGGTDKVYLDNLHIYLTEEAPIPTPAPTAEPTATPEPTAKPTAEPTAEPTATPVVGTPNPVTFENYTLGASVRDSEGAGYKWTEYYDFNSGASEIVSKQALGFDAAPDDYCLAIHAGEFTNGSNPEFDLNIAEFTDFMIDTADGVAPTKDIVVEMDLAVVGTDVKSAAYGLLVGIDGARIAQFVIGDDFVGHQNTTTFSATANMEYKASTTKGEFFHLKYIVSNNGENGRFYINDVPVGKPTKQIQATTTAINFLRFQAKNEGAVVDSKLLIDNIQVYAEDVVVPDVLVDDDMNDHVTGDLLATPDFNETDDKYHVWSVPAALKNNAQYVSKSTIVSGAAADDYCLEFTNTVSGTIQFLLDTDKALAHGAGTTGFTVLEMDVAVSGALTSQVEFQINPAPESNQSFDRFQLNGNTLALRQGGGNETLVNNQFHNVKFVIDRANEKYCAIFDGEVFVRDRAKWLGTNFGSIAFVLPAGSAECGKVYIDNMKVYTLDEAPEPVKTPAPTAKPTPVPTASPTPNPLTFENYVVGAKVNGTGTGTGYTWNRINSASDATGTVVSKADAGFTGAAPTDYCLVLDASKVEGKETGYNLAIENATDFAINTAGAATKYITVEMDLAVKGDTKAEGFGLLVGNSSYRVAQFFFDNAQMGNHGDTTFADYNNEFVTETTPGEFFHLKYVVANNGTNGRFYVNGNSIGKPMTVVQEATTAIDLLRFQIKGEDAATNTQFYIDNINVYATDIVDSDVIVDADMNTPPESNLLSDKKFNEEQTHYSWFIDGDANKPVTFVKKDTIVSGANADDYVLAIPNGVAGDYRIVFDSDKVFTYGAEATGYAVVEMDVAISAAFGADARIELNNEHPDTQSMERFVFNGTSMSVYGDGGSVTLVPNQFYNVKYVIDRANGTYFYVVDGETQKYNVGKLHEDTHDAFGNVKFTVAGSGTDELLYVDNIKVYSVDTNPVPAPTAAPTAKPTYNPPVLEGYELGETVANTSGEGAKWATVNTDYVAGGYVVSKAGEGLTGGTGDDYCVAFDSEKLSTYGSAGGDGGYLFYGLTDEKFAFDNTGATVATKNIVVEMEIAIKSDEPKTNGYWLMIGGTNDEGNWTQRCAQFAIYDDRITRHSGSSGEGSGLIGSEEITQGEFFTLKWVMPNSANKGEGTKWYVNDVLIAKDTKAFNVTPDNISMIRFSARHEDTAVKSKLYVDNIKIYEEPITSNIDENWDRFEAGTLLEATTNDDCTWSVNSAYENSVKVVAKNSFDTTAAADDMCIEIPYVHAAGQNGSINFMLDKSSIIPLGEGQTGYAVVEVDVAISGADLKNQFGVYVSRYNDGNTHSVARTTIDDGILHARWDDGDDTYVYESTDVKMEKNQFYTLKFVVNKATKQVSYSVNNGPALLYNVSCYHTEDNVPNIGNLFINVPTENYDKDAKIYVDNFKVYEVAENPMTETFSLEDLQVTLGNSEIACTDKQSIVSVNLNGTSLVEGQHYNAVWSENKVTLTGIAPYVGQKVVTWKTTHASVDEKGYCTIEGCEKIANGKYALYGRNLNLSDDIGVIFWMEFTDAVSINDVEMTISLKNNKSETIPGHKAIYRKQDDGKVTYGFRCSMYASEMNQDITAELSIGGEYAFSYQYSVAEYCTNQKENPEAAADQNLMNMINSVLVFGDKAQLHFGKETGDLVSGSVGNVPALEALNTEEVAALNAFERKDNHTTEGYLTGVSMTLVLFAKTSLRAGLYFEAGYGLSDFTYEAYNVTKGGKVVEGKTGTYGGVDYFEIPNITPTELDNVYKVVIKHGDTVVKELEYSPYTYIKNKKDITKDYLNEVVTALYRYCEAAKAYEAANKTN